MLQLARWSAIVRGVEHGDPDAASELYRSFARHRTFFASRFSADNADDLYHDLMVSLLASIRNGAVKQPERLAGYVMTVARRVVIEHLRALSRSRWCEPLDGASGEAAASPPADEEAIRHEIASLARRVLEGMSPRDRAVIVRFYIEEQSADRICEDLHLNHAQFRGIKSRAKARFAKLMRRQTAPPPPADPPHP